MLRKYWFILLLVVSAIMCSAQDSPASLKARHFKFHYAFTVKDVKPGQRLRVWIPLAHADTWQDVKVMSKSGDLPLKQVAQPQYGNQLFYAEAAKANKPEYKFAIDYDVVRREHVVLWNGKLATDAHPESVPKVELARFLQADRLVPITGVPAELAAQQTQSSYSPLEKAQDIYDYVFHTMKYDKSGSGWGHGDTLWACDSKRGNCTDFHSVFISMARSQQIPARFQIGFPLPADKSSSEIPGYHCWAEFYIDSIGWIPIDISEAWKHQEKHSYFFGAHDVNRVQFSQGRDLKLAPPQKGAPLNYFVYPYVEVAGQEYPNISNAFSFEDVSTNSGLATTATQ